MQQEDSKYDFPISYGRFTLLKLLGAGGMGEVFLAHDPVCQRTLALKRMSDACKVQSHLRERFKKEVEITAKLSHPNTITVYELYEDSDELYYTMPYLEGENLHIKLKKIKLLSEKGLTPDTIGGSIPMLIQTFVSTCRAIDHAHTKGILHRDLKPGNIMVGLLGEVTVLDWGLAATQKDPSEELPRAISQPGTIEFMAPERAYYHRATIQSDIYSLGAILYYMLALEYPYKRPDTFDAWQKQLTSQGPEPPIDPQMAAPEREISEFLSRITLKCLHPDPEKRYLSAQALLSDLEHYLQGQPVWIPVQNFDRKKASDWALHEPAVIKRKKAISRSKETQEKVFLMLSPESYLGNIQIQAAVQLKRETVGIGIALCVPDTNLQEGFLVWIKNKEAKLYHNQAPVIRIDAIDLDPESSYQFTVEKQDTFIRFFIDDKPILTYVSQTPILGGRFGLVTQDDQFALSPLTLAIGSQPIRVNCLSIPDAFFTHKEYAKARTHYQRIALSFQGRPEAWKAFFRAGVTCLQEDKNVSQAADNFEALRQTPGAPIEHLGKALIYQTQNKILQEVHALETGLSKFLKHPLRHILSEHVLFRLHETAQHDRLGAHAFALLALTQTAHWHDFKETELLLSHMETNWETLPFILAPEKWEMEEKKFQRCLLLSFWLGSAQLLCAQLQTLSVTTPHYSILKQNGLLALLHLNHSKVTLPAFIELKSKVEAQSLPDQKNKEFLTCFLESRLTPKEAPKQLEDFKKINGFDDYKIWALLLAKKKREPEPLLKDKSIHSPDSPYFMLFGCYLALTQGEKAAVKHFEIPFDQSFPKTSALLAHYLQGNISLSGDWFEGAFLYEKIQLYRHLVLYYTCLNHPQKAAHFEKEILRVKGLN